MVMYFCFREARGRPAPVLVLEEAAFSFVKPDISMLWPVAVDNETELLSVITKFSLFAIL